MQCLTTSFSGGCLLGLALDSWDLDFYTKRFQELQRNPSTVEVFDLAQSNRWGGMGTFWCLRVWMLEDHRDPPWLSLGLRK